MCIYIHTLRHIYIYIYVYTHIYTHIHTCMHAYILTYIHTYIFHFTSTHVGVDDGPQREREGEGGERSRYKTGYHSRQGESANGTAQVGALAQSCVQAVHDSGS